MLDAQNSAYGKPSKGGKGMGPDLFTDSDKGDRGLNSNKQERRKKNKQEEQEEKAFVSKDGVVKNKEEKKKVVRDKEIDFSKLTEEIVDVDETRQPASLVFIGHVDAGKSTICGNLMYLLGVVDKRQIEKYKQEAKDKGRDSWWLAYVMDINEDEKAKGKTVEVGRANFDLESKRYTVFDAPGHKNYVPNMIQGAALADFGGLVISARKGEYEAGFDREGQTREHAQLAKSLGVQKLIIIVNKMDDCKWSK